jgi:hypothetical protein
LFVLAIPVQQSGVTKLSKYKENVVKRIQEKKFCLTAVITHDEGIKQGNNEVLFP